MWPARFERILEAIWCVIMFHQADLECVVGELRTRVVDVKEEEEALAKCV